MHLRTMNAQEGDGENKDELQTSCCRPCGSIRPLRRCYWPPDQSLIDFSSNRRDSANLVRVVLRWRRPPIGSPLWSPSCERCRLRRLWEKQALSGCV